MPCESDLRLMACRHAGHIPRETTNNLDKHTLGIPTPAPLYPAHVKTDGNMVQPVRREKLVRNKHNPLSLPDGDRFERRAEAPGGFPLDLNKYHGIAVPGDQIDLAPRTTVIPRKDFISDTAEKLLGDLLALPSQPGTLHLNPTTLLYMRDPRCPPEGTLEQSGKDLHSWLPVQRGKGHTEIKAYFALLATPFRV